MEHSHEKIVNFAYCKFCVNRNQPETFEECADCLANPVNIDSQRPVRFKDNGSLERIRKSLNKNITKGE